MLDIMKWFKRWGIKRSNVALMWCYDMIIQDISVKVLRMKWQDAKMLELDYYIANVTISPIQGKNVNIGIFFQYKEKMPKLIQSYWLPNMACLQDSTRSASRASNCWVYTTDQRPWCS